MKFLIFCLSILLFSIQILAQQNFINVPSSEVTTKNKFFFQQQINFNELIQSNTTIDYGLGRGFEIGVNVLGLNYSEKHKSFLKNDVDDRDPYNPLFMLNAQKAWEFNKHFTATLGTQFGVNYDFDEKKGNAGLLFTNLKKHQFLVKNGVLVTGLYYNSTHYGGRGNRIGGWLGTELPISNKFHFLAESVIGNNAISYSSIAFVYYPIGRMPLTLGFQIPNTKTNSTSIVFELTIIP
jgi:hypothetical protein